MKHPGKMQFNEWDDMFHLLDPGTDITPGTDQPSGWLPARGARCQQLLPTCKAQSKERRKTRKQRQMWQ